MRSSVPYHPKANRVSWFGPVADAGTNIDAGQDWFLFNADGDGAQDRVTDMSTFEAMFAQDIDFISG